MTPESMPDERCGFSLTPEGKMSHNESMAEFHVRTEAVCCFREVWDESDNGRCFWHANIEEKPAHRLAERDEVSPVRLDGAVLRSVSTGSPRMIAGACLRGADLRDSSFTGADLKKTDFSNADLRDVDFSDAALRSANFSNADLRRAQFTEAALHDAIFADADCYRTEFNNATLERASFPDARLFRADLSNTYAGSSDLRNADLRDSSLVEGQFYGADLTGANLTNANCTDTVVQHADLSNCTLEDALLTRMDLRNATLSDADLFEAQFADVRINTQTSFDRTCRYGREERMPGIADDEEDGIGSPYEAAAWVYHQLERVHQDHAMTDVARQYHIQAAEARRTQHKQSNQYGRYLVGTLNRYLTNHGESLRHVMYSSAFLMLLFGILYPLGGIVDDGQLYQYATLSNVLSIDGGATVLRGLYFSVITFSTIGYANVAPGAPISRLLVGVESLAGAILIALFVFVLGRRTQR